VAHRLRPAIRAGLLVAALIFTTALTAACRGVLATSSSASGQQVTVKAHDTMRFDPPTISVPVGQPVQVTLANDGTLIHDLVFGEGVAQPVKIEANGKTSVSATLTIAQPGTYTYICAQPGHEAAGMKGTIVAR
jgi:nitrite reductase (NO-forming)